MAKIKPFRAVRPIPEKVGQVSVVPYDVVNRAEAKEFAEGNPDSFIRVIRSEIEFDDSVNPYVPEIYERAKSNFAALLDSGTLIQEDEAAIYIYQLEMDGRVQTGVVALSSLDEYRDDLIKKHEKTRPEKENDRTTHIGTLRAQTGLVFLTYQANDDISSLVQWAIKADPLYNFTADDGVRHTIWKLADSEAIVAAFAKLPHTYVADGHHRIASAARCRDTMQESNENHSGDESYNFVISVLFPHSELAILPYNRIVYSLGEHTAESVLAQLQEVYDVSETSDAVPQQKGESCLFIDGRWWRLAPRAGETLPDDPIERLEVSILASKVLKPIFGIHDERTDENIDFIGGIRGTAELERLVNDGTAQCAFSVYPTAIEELMEVADSGLIMAPKSTWFEPKLRSGILVHKFED